MVLFYETVLFWCLFFKVVWLGLYIVLAKCKCILFTSPWWPLTDFSWVATVYSISLLVSLVSFYLYILNSVTWLLRLNSRQIYRTMLAASPPAYSVKLSTLEFDQCMSVGTFKEALLRKINAYCHLTQDQRTEGESKDSSAGNDDMVWTPSSHQRCW